MFRDIVIGTEWEPGDGDDENPDDAGQLAPGETTTEVVRGYVDGNGEWVIEDAG